MGRPRLGQSWAGRLAASLAKGQVAEGSVSPEGGSAGRSGGQQLSWLRTGWPAEGSAPKEVVSKWVVTGVNTAKGWWLRAERLKAGRLGGAASKNWNASRREGWGHWPDWMAKGGAAKGMAAEVKATEKGVNQNAEVGGKFWICWR